MITKYYITNGKKFKKKGLIVEELQKQDVKVKIESLDINIHIQSDIHIQIIQITFSPRSFPPGIKRDILLYRWKHHHDSD